LLTSRIRATVEDPATDDAFDPHAALDELLQPLGLGAKDAGGEISFLGADPVVPSPLRLGGAAALALVAKSVAVAAVHRDRGGPGQDIVADLRSAPHRLCPFYDRRWELLNGYPPASPANVTPAFGFGFNQTRDGRWVMPLNGYPKLKVAAQKLLGVPDDPAALAAAIARWDAADLEEAGSAAGIVMPLVRTPQEWLDTAQHGFLEDTAPVTLRRIGDAPPQPLPALGEQPLDGLRALGMGHVIAGAGTGRTLALHGADVLNVWRPTEFEHDGVYVTANVGVRSTMLDKRSEKIRELLAGADVFYANRRPGYLDSIGLSAEEAASTRPGIVYATNSLHGEAGPWRARVGFDQTAGALTGMATLEGGDGPPRLSPIMVVNDYIVSWLTTAGILAALRRRAVEGGSWAVHVSLVRAALWILQLGVFDLDYARSVAGTGDRHAYLDPETFTAATPLGDYQGVTDQIRMSATPGEYRTVLVPRGSCRPEWTS
jgi:crotonobetainyl-CoA:carnitine CoA-transferase CaiB-like acyl-CoA transferase